jgi:ABC-type nitrate/sulfonate/bicarbonate transport system substrate-binding protein
VTGWYAKADWLNANRDTAKRFVDVMLQTAKWGNAHHPESAAILAKYVGMTADAIQNSPRAVYGEKPIQPAMIQPVLDFSTKYIGLDKTSAAALIWRA